MDLRSSQWNPGSSRSPYHWFKPEQDFPLFIEFWDLFELKALCQQWWEVSPTNQSIIFLPCGHQLHYFVTSSGELKIGIKQNEGSRRSIFSSSADKSVDFKWIWGADWQYLQCQVGTSTTGLQQGWIFPAYRTKKFYFFIFIKPKMAILSGNRARAEAGWNSCLNQAFHYHGCPCAGGSGSCIYFFYYLFTHSPSFHAAIPKTRYLLGFSVCRKSDQLACSTAVKQGISPSNEKIVHSGQGT